MWRRRGWIEVEGHVPGGGRVDVEVVLRDGGDVGVVAEAEIEVGGRWGSIGCCGGVELLLLGQEERVRERRCRWRSAGLREHRGWKVESLQHYWQ